MARKRECNIDDQLAPALDELETAAAQVQVEAEMADPARKAAAARKRRASHTETLDHLPHEEVVIEPESKVGPLLRRPRRAFAIAIAPLTRGVAEPELVVATNRTKRKFCGRREPSYEAVRRRRQIAQGIGTSTVCHGADHSIGPGAA